MEKKNSNENGVDVFYGFWKYLGVMGVFFTGVSLFYWGSQIMINDWILIRESTGFLGNIVLAPLVAGTVLSWMSFAEFLRIIREE